jgi:hypothetical protein
MGAAFNNLMEEETKESLAEMCCDLMDEIAVLKASREFLDEDFLELMNDIGRLGHETLGADAVEVSGDRTRRIPRHQKDANILHVYRHITEYADGIKHDHFGTLKHQLAAAAFNCLMEYYFSQGE